MNTEHIEKVKKELIDIFDKSDEEVLSVSIGEKRANGEFTGEKSIRFGVVKKKSLSEIPAKKIIPNNIIIDGVEYKTDVFEIRTPSINLQKVTNQQSEATSSMFQTPSGSFFPSVGNNNYEVSALEFTHCTTYKLITTIPGDAVYLNMENICGRRTSSGFFTDQQTFCCDNDNPPQAGTGYTWQVHDPFNNGLSQRCIMLNTCNNNYIGPPVGYSPYPPTTDHRQKIRPLIGGISMINRQNDGEGYVATLGAIVTDSTDGKMVGLTNAHVSGTPSYLNNGSKVPYFLASDEFGGLATHYTNIENTQPSNGDSIGFSFLEEDKVGNTKRTFPLSSANYNYIDCAITNLSDSVVSTDSWKQLHIDLSSAPQFATTEEIDSITISTPLASAGRTSGPRGTYVTQSSYPTGRKTSVPCGFIATSTSATVGVSGYTTDSSLVYFTDVIFLEFIYPYCVTPVLGGDSGSVLLAYLGGAWKIVGLIFAGNGGDLGIACRIDNVARLMKLEAYTGNAVDANPNTPTYVNLNYASYANQVSASIGGKIYWQVGKV